jgi:alpha-D-ribose 1-methylphosphonate 5-triphosphate synthase subunit PhnG
VVSKLVAGREKDRVFAAALLDAGLIQANTLMERARMLDELPGVIRRIVKWIEWWESRFQSRP